MSHVRKLVCVILLVPETRLPILQARAVCSSCSLAKIVNNSVACPARKIDLADIIAVLLGLTFVLNQHDDHAMCRRLCLDSEVGCAETMFWRLGFMTVSQAEICQFVSLSATLKAMAELSLHFGRRAKKSR